jgi:DNA polymerase III gamma/tau subunit
MLEFLVNAAKKGKLAHGYLFWGGDNEEMKDTAFKLAEFLKTDPFDVLHIVPEEDKKEISIGQIRKTRKHLSLSAYNSTYKFTIIQRAEAMNQEASNALLKTLEEPQGNTILILIAQKPELLPKTILSRLQEIRFKPVSLTGVSKNFFNKEYINLLQKPLNDVFKAVEKISKEETEIFPLLDCWLFFFRDLLINRSATTQQRNKFVKIIKEIQKTKDLISTTNLNQRLALENLFLCIKD